MIRLAYNNLENTIEFQENYINVLTIENPKVLRNFVSEVKRLCNNEDNLICVSKNLELVNRVDFIDFVESPLSINMNNKKFISKIIDLINLQMQNEKEYSQTNDILGRLNAYYSDILSQIGYDLSFRDFDASTIIKSSKIFIEEDTESLPKQICEYMRLVTEVLKKDYFIFLNLKCFLDKEELYQLYKTCRYNKYKVLLVEASEKEPLDGELITIYDYDLCRIV